MYWAEEAVSLLEASDPTRSLQEQLVPSAFALPNAPIWQDSSTTSECRQMEAAAGGPQALANLTGSRAYERFTASQIMKVGGRFAVNAARLFFNKKSRLGPRNLRRTPL